MLAQYHGHYIKFYLKEIRDIQISKQTFEKEDKLMENIDNAVSFWFNPAVEPFEVTFLLDDDIVVYFERKPIKGQYLKKNCDGTAELTINVTDKKEVFFVMKKWLFQIRIIEPYKLQAEFNVMIKKYLASLTIVQNMR